ncbi:MAG: DNA polymerase/3'-5' exonuclease PolX [Chloroflexi bacterium]|nr:DNA polymerase/3'-5' exonuclease PolX [Chloroflexota bacterium]
MNNGQIAEVFENIAGLLEMRGEKVFTIRAYQRAARTIERLPSELEDMVRDEQDLKEIPGIGKAISEKIAELVNTNELGYYDRLKAEFPEGILDLMQIPGLGPKTTRRLWKELDVTSVELLEESIKDGRLASLPRLGKKTAENIAKQISFARTKSRRMPIARALPIATRIIDALRSRCPSIQKIQYAGSLRRYEETIGDIDLVCTSGSPQEVLDALVALPNVVDVLGHGDTKASVYLSDRIQIDLRVVDDRHYGSLMQYFTGNLQHNIQLRDHANSLGLSLNEYGLTHVDDGKQEEFADEESLYERMGLQYVPPEIRTGIWEIQAALEHRIPRLVEVADVRGDLHDHTDWSDGRDPMEVMVAAAKDRGLQYLAITDHSVGRGIANGLSIERLSEHMKMVRDLDARNPGIRLLCGTEMDIRADGTLDYPDSVLQELDWVVASVHSAMGQDRQTMTERIIAAMRNPYVDVIGHLSTRLIGERQPIEADFDAIFKAALETGTAMEINASPERLDLKDSHIARAREIGVPLVINTDAHTEESLDNVHYGIAMARRGWCEPHHIVNTLELPKFLEFLDAPKSERMKVFLQHA